MITESSEILLRQNFIHKMHTFCMHDLFIVGHYQNL